MSENLADAFLNGKSLKNAPGPYFGEYGGRGMPESLIAAMDELETTFNEAKNDPEFLAEFKRLSAEYSNRPSLLTEVPKFSEHAGARVFLKREDLNHTGSHKINNVLGQALLAKRRKRVSLEDFDKVLAEGEVDTLNLVIKGDVSGAVEALEDSLLRIDVGDEVALRIIHRGVGAITQNDVNLATVDNAVIIGFNVRPAERVAEMADAEGVEIKYYNVIYSAIDDIEAALKGMLKPIYEEVQLGTAEIRQVFRSGKFGNIAGSIVRSGTIKRGTKARLVRDGVVVADNLEIASLRREKDDVTEVREGYECGITLGYKDIAEGDVIETWEMREKARD